MTSSLGPSPSCSRNAKPSFQSASLSHKGEAAITRVWPLGTHVKSSMSNRGSLVKNARDLRTTFNMTCANFRLFGAPAAANATCQSSITCVGIGLSREEPLLETRLNESLERAPSSRRLRRDFNCFPKLSMRAINGSSDTRSTSCGLACWRVDERVPSVVGLARGDDEISLARVRRDAERRLERTFFV